MFGIDTCTHTCVKSHYIVWCEAETDVDKSIHMMEVPLQEICDLFFPRNQWLEFSEESRAPATLVPYNGRVWRCQTTHERKLGINMSKAVAQPSCQMSVFGKNGVSVARVTIPTCCSCMLITN